MDESAHKYDVKITLFQDIAFKSARDAKIQKDWIYRLRKIKEKWVQQPKGEKLIFVMK